MHYVIIGNSAAGVGAIEGIRKEDKEGKITVISDETYHCYSRPLISYYLKGDVKLDKMYYRDLDFYEKNSVNCMFGTKVVSIDLSKKCVVLEDNTSVEYDKLLIATGGRPFIPPADGLESEDINTFIKMADSVKVDGLLKGKTGQRALIVGAGLIGLKAAEALIHRGVKVTVVELASKVLGSILDDSASDMVSKNLKDHGIEVINNDTISEILKKNGLKTAVLKSGKEVEYDFMIMAVGVLPNIDIVKDTQIEINRGIIVDCSMKTNVQDIYAAGDVTECKNIITDDKRVIPIWPKAYEQGLTAGVNMSGGSCNHEGFMPMNAIAFFGQPIITAGITDDKEDRFEVLSLLDKDKGVYKKILIDNDVIKGFVRIGDIDRAGILTGFMKTSEDISAIKESLLDDDFGYITFSKDLRIKKLRKY